MMNELYKTRRTYTHNYACCLCIEITTHTHTHALTHSLLRGTTFVGEGQFGRVFKALAEGICPHDSNRKIVAVKTLKGKWTSNYFLVPLSKHTGMS